MPTSKGSARALRASAVLTASYVASTVLPVSQVEAGLLLCTYTRGAAGGYPSIALDLSWDGTTWWQATVADTAAAFSAPSANLTVYQVVYDLAAPDGAAAVLYAVPIDLRSARLMRVRCKETGVSGTPGTLAVLLQEHYRE